MSIILASTTRYMGTNVSLSGFSVVLVDGDGDLALFKVE